VNAFADRSGRAFYAGLLEGLIRVMGMWHGYLFQHGPRVSVIALRLGHSFELDRQQLSELFFGAVLSDLGMIGLVEEALENPKPSLTTEARAQVKIHPNRSAETVSAIPYLEDVAPLVANHHEWWDGSGYPHGLSGEDIPLGARILRVADTVAALGEDRPQRPKLDASDIRKEIQQGLGHEFSPEVGKRFIGLMDKGEVHGFNDVFFRQSMLKAVEHLLPTEISGVSADHLLEIFAGLIDAKDPYTGGHSRRVAALGYEVAQKMGLDERVQDTTRAAGYLHDVGKVSTPRREPTSFRPSPPFSISPRGLATITSAGTGRGIRRESPGAGSPSWHRFWRSAIRTTP
jgi:HD-GYP domain-containing protein (c-di-GMP phosphodiesterase class II)